MSLYDLKNSKKTWANLKTESIESDGVVGLDGLTAVSAGNVGERIFTYTVAPVNMASKNTTKELTSISLSPGFWAVDGSFEFVSSDASQLSECMSIVSLISASDGGSAGYNRFKYEGTATTISGGTPYQYFQSAIPTTVYLNGSANWGTGNVDYIYKLQAIRIA